MPKWSIYIVRCANRSLYTGIATDITARLKSHNAGTGAKYTRSFGPVTLVYSEPMDSESSARKREAEIKRMNKKDKEKLVERSPLQILLRTDNFRYVILPNVRLPMKPGG